MQSIFIYWPQWYFLWIQSSWISQLTCHVYFCLTSLVFDDSAGINSQDLPFIFYSVYRHLWMTAGKLSDSLFPHYTMPIDKITLTESVSSEEPFISFFELGSFFKLFCKNILTSEFSEASIRFSWPRIFKKKKNKHKETIYKTSNDIWTH